MNMTEIKTMYHNGNGEIVFQDANDRWWRLESYNPEVGTAHEWMPVVATRTDAPEV